MEKIACSYRQIVDAFGRPAVSDNSGWEKTNFKWFLETDNGTPFSIYNRFEQGRTISMDEVVEWNIESKDPKKSQEVVAFVDSSVLKQNIEESKMLQRRAGIKRR